MDDRQRLIHLEEKVTSVEIRLAVAESNIKEIKEDIDSIKDNTTWILRLVVGGLIGGVVSFIISNGVTM